MKYRKRPVVIDAVVWTGENTDEVLAFAESNSFIEAGSELLITTLEGVMHVSPGDYVIRGVVGEYYPCKPDIFQKTYEAI